MPRPRAVDRMVEIGGPVRDITPEERREANLRPTGQEIFDSLSKAEQDEMLGPEAAEMVRNGDAVLSDFVEVDGGFITQKPVTALEGKAAIKRKELRAYFGAFGDLPPNMIFTDNIPEQFQGLVFQDERGMRQVQLRPSQVLELALRGGGQQRATALVVHEWRHIFQNASLFYIGREQPHDQQPIEQDAHNFASRVLNLIYKNRSRKRKRKPLIRPVPYNPENISENIGKDPTTIPYP
jgi:hypothetical protein